jgi:nucleoside-diphosphate-sugar epimerase
MSRILVTGANGHVGCHLVRACRDAGHQAIAFVRPGSDRRGLGGLEVEAREASSKASRRSSASASPTCATWRARTF